MGLGMNSILSVHNVHKVFVQSSVNVHVLKGVTFNLYPKDSVAILGLSGSGKSTLLHLLGLLDVPTEGTIEYDGESFHTLSENERVRVRRDKIGFVFQKPFLIGELNVLENVMLPLLIEGRPSVIAKAEAEDMLCSIGLKERLLFKVSQLSGGEQQRVSIARALVKKPPLLLADEPTGNLDYETGNKVFEALTKLCADQKTALIMVTHNRELASRMSRQIHLIDGVGVEGAVS